MVGFQYNVILHENLFQGEDSVGFFVFVAFCYFLCFFVVVVVGG